MRTKLYAAPAVKGLTSEINEFRLLSSPPHLFTLHFHCERNKCYLDVFHCERDGIWMFFIVNIMLFGCFSL